MRSNPCYGYDFTAYCSQGPIYVLFSTDGSWTTAGNFVNSDNDATPFRYFRTDFTGTIPGSVIDYSYDASAIVNSDGAGVTYNGTGGLPASYFYNNNCTPPTIVLPIELISFTASPEKNKIKLSWQTASEKNNDFFTVLKSEDGLNFKSLSRIKGKGTVTNINDYVLFDEEPITGNSYYRLQQTDFDGSSTLSEIISIRYSAFSLNKAITEDQDYIYLRLPENIIHSYNVELYNMMGQSLLKKETVSGEFFKIKKPTSKGIYIISLISSEQVFSKKIIIP
jgi:hypothetical protein